jgi:hypothetical protein
LLHERYPSLGLRHVQLGHGPTPVSPLPRLGVPAIDATEVWLKDESGYGDGGWGGNKVRKLEWIIPEAHRRGVRTLFTVGGIGTHWGLAAALYGVFFEITQYNVGFLLGIKAFTAAVLGGIGNIRGALIGGLVLGLIENYGASIFGTQWLDVVAFSVLVLVLMFRPTGILGENLQRARA